MFCCIKDWRRIATRYERCALAFLAAITLAAIFILLAQGMRSQPYTTA
jgi:transposase